MYAESKREDRFTRGVALRIGAGARRNWPERRGDWLTLFGVSNSQDHDDSQDVRESTPGSFRLLGSSTNPVVVVGSAS
jgi:hypothetical protein